MTTDFKIDEIVILKNNEQREEIIAKNGEFIIDTYPGMKLNPDYAIGKFQSKQTYYKI